MLSLPSATVPLPLQATSDMSSPKSHSKSTKSSSKSSQKSHSLKSPSATSKRSPSKSPPGSPAEPKSHKRRFSPQSTEAKSSAQTKPNPDIDNHDDPDDDDCSARGSAASMTVSLSSSVLNYRKLYGRTYENTESAEYWAPNDEQQNEGLDLVHNALFLVLDDQLFLAPIGEHPKRVLDIGTGTGIWAIAFGDEYPEAEVIGTDLSPIQPEWVPPNVKFVIEDCLLDWTWPLDYFDFIHIRTMYGSIPDWVDLYKKAYVHLAPGGWVQDLEMDVRIQSDHVKLPPDHIFNRWADLFCQGGEMMGRSFDVCKGHTMRDNLEAAGFVDIVEKKFKAPVHSWASDTKLWEAGSLIQAALEQSIEGYAILLLMDLMGWYREEVAVLLGLYRNEMRVKKNCGWVETTVVYGRKPLASEVWFEATG
ncbi:hypothetical protein NW762_003022 [Fusarium torreyae]|uniref:Methyltransferase n=1 Tax=Fusarium torreyae TaxID=1237075 RepID=A0A9W8SD35_9HYPO|nr:hypothetical protein NW762_003022 [Fusarium torreyae]